MNKLLIVAGLLGSASQVFAADIATTDYSTTPLHQAVSIALATKPVDKDFHHAVSGAEATRPVPTCAVATASSATSTEVKPACDFDDHHVSGAISTDLENGTSAATDAKEHGPHHQKGGKVAKQDATLTTTDDDTSAVEVTEGGSLTLTDSTVITTGKSSKPKLSHEAGQDAAVVAKDASTVTITDTTVSTSGAAADAVFAHGGKTKIALSDTTVTTSGTDSNGVVATADATVVATDTEVTTTADDAAAVATTADSGTVKLKGAHLHTAGDNAPAIDTTSTVVASDTTAETTGDSAVVVVEGTSTVTLKNTTLTGGHKKLGAIAIVEDASGSATTSKSTVTVTGGSVTAEAGPAITVANVKTDVKLKDVAVTADSGVLVKAAANAQWGVKGKNGAVATVTADAETLDGDLVADKLSTLSATLKNGTELTGKITNAALTLDATSTWSVEGNSTLTTLTSSETTTAAALDNIKGNGHTVTYDATLKANKWLKSKSYKLVNGGKLTPKS